MMEERFKLMKKFENGTIDQDELVELRDILSEDMDHMFERELECVSVGFLLGITQAALIAENIGLARDTARKLFIN